ncbi:hypothetical protein IMZ08_11605 [Bacillus luteolus]|uniref:Coupling factor for flagellin transcription and translation n=1 Tax=Litchfieldia luteola TaxID=682179 RepID=A0ABR9QJM5_9BACI|nr:hypothetical protein [Cytobacillus luteolus]MBE4908702.1 hypothetical protein [Cytobacillus luteolus]MBP1941559.1 hypothetical protein [Cytobacillus luteolus]
MTTFLLLFCFVLIAIAYLLIIVLYQKFSTIKELEKKQSTIIHEMEQMITIYLMEMKEENEAFLTKLSRDEKDLDSSYDKGEKNLTHSSSKDKSFNNEPFEIIEESLTTQEMESLLPKYDDENKLENNVQNKVYTNPTILKQENAIGEAKSTFKIKDDLYVQSLSAQALLLQKKGESIEQIAKKLGKGNTEIELLLKFRQN